MKIVIDVPEHEHHHQHHQHHHYPTPLFFFCYHAHSHSPTHINHRDDASLPPNKTSTLKASIIAVNNDDIRLFTPSCVITLLPFTVLSYYRLFTNMPLLFTKSTFNTMHNLTFAFNANDFVLPILCLAHVTIPFC